MNAHASDGRGVAGAPDSPRAPILVGVFIVLAAFGGFGTCLYPDGYFDFGVGGDAGDPHEPVHGGPGCAFGGGHYLNDKVEHSCSLDGFGKVQLEIKQVRMSRCDRED